MKQIVNRVYDYQDRDSNPAWCYLELWQDGKGQSVAIVTEPMGENSGTGVTSAAEELATAISAEYGLDSARIMWIECFEDVDPFTFPMPATPAATLTK